MKREKEELSIQFTIRKYSLVLIVLAVFVMVIFWLFFISKVHSEMENFVKASLEVLTSDLKEQMKRADVYMIDLDLNNAAFHRLGVKEKELAVFDDVYTLRREFENQVDVCDGLNAVYLYSAANQKEYLCYGNLQSYSIEKIQDFKRMVRACFGNAAFSSDMEENRWIYQNVDGYNLLYKFISYQGVICTVVFDLDNLLLQYEDDNCAFFLWDGQENLKEKKKIMEQTCLSEDTFGSVKIGITRKNYQAFQNESLLAGILTVVSVCLLGIIFVAWAQINNRGIRRVSQMELDLKQMEIERYENELREQKLRMVSLQRQIRPHFYLSCLKSIYVLAEKGRYENIKSSILALSRHLRYVLSSSDNTIALGKEIEHMLNYVELYRSSFQKLVLLSVDIPKELDEFQIPEISLLTFLENSIKYCNFTDKALKILVSARRTETKEGSRIHLTFRDNGQGFSQEMLDILNKEELEFVPDGHVGIYNVVYRCRILYKQKSYIAFFNDSGAVIDMYLPMD